MKPYSEQTADERLASLDRIMNILLHPDWQEMQARISDDSVRAHIQMDEAANWDTFVAARGVYLYTQYLLNLRDHVSAEKADLEADKAAPEEVLLPTDYERE